MKNTNMAILDHHGGEKFVSQVLLQQSRKNTLNVDV